MKWSTSEISVLIECPHCGAEAGDWCWDEGDEERRVRPHKARCDEAEGYIYDAGRIPQESDE